MTTLEIGDEIFRELNQPTTTSPAAIAIWLKFNVGKINSALNKEYTTNLQTMEIEPALGEKEKYIFKKMYIIFYYDWQFRTSLGAAASDVISVTSDGATVRKVNRNEVSKSWLQAKKDEQEQLDKAIRDYKISEFEPLQVAGDDTIAANYSTSDYDRLNN